MKVVKVYLHFGVGKSDVFSRRSRPSVQVNCFLFANSFILHSHLTLENIIIGKYVSVASMQGALGSSLESLILCSHVTIYLLIWLLVVDFFILRG